MARPKVPLISRRKSLDAALKIMDTEGLDALSIRRLAAELGVNGASLYHHFKNKDEIVTATAELALARVRTPETSDEKWRTWLPRNNEMLREAILDHPELVPVIVRKGELGMGAQMMESSARRLVEEGVPIGAVAPLMEALEMFAIGSAIYESRDDRAHSDKLPRNSTLAKAARSRALSPDEQFTVVSEAIVKGLRDAIVTKLGDGRTKEPARRRAPAKKSAPAKATRRAAKTTTPAKNTRTTKTPRAARSTRNPR